MALLTNDSESINAILKDCVGFKKQKWAVFNNILKTAVNKQQKQFVKAIASLGQYCLGFLSVLADKWFRMTTDQYLHYIKNLIIVRFAWRMVLIFTLVITTSLLYIAKT